MGIVQLKSLHGEGFARLSLPCLVTIVEELSSEFTELTYGTAEETGRGALIHLATVQSRAARG